MLRAAYGPHEKSVMHEHPTNAAVFLTYGQARFTLPDGKTQDAPPKAGTMQWDAGDMPLELILVELQGKPAAVR